MLTLESLIPAIQKSDINRHKLVAVAHLRSGHILTKAVNCRAEGAISPFSIHAEEALVIRANKLRLRERFDHIEVLVARWSAAQNWKLARPCAACERLLRLYGFEHVRYTSGSGTELQYLF